MLVQLFFRKYVLEAGWQALHCSDSLSKHVGVLQDRHIRKDGTLVQHLCGKHLSSEMQAFIDTCLYQKMDSFGIVKEARILYLNRVQLQHQLPSHAAVLEALDLGTIPRHRDFLLNFRDIDNRRTRLEKQLWKFTDDDAQNVRLLYMLHREDFLLYQEQGDAKAFIAVVQTKWQREKLLQLGHNNAILMDATFNTNKHKVTIPADALISEFCFEWGAMACSISWLCLVGCG